MSAAIDSTHSKTGSTSRKEVHRSDVPFTDKFKPFSQNQFHKGVLLPTFTCSFKITTLMKQTLILLLTVLVSVPVLSQEKKYQKAMLGTIQEMHEAGDPESSQRIATLFEEIAQDYPDQWMPCYYASQILIFTCFEESDPAAKDDLLDRAKKSLENAMELAPEESEVSVLQALYYLGMMSVEPDTRGPEYYMDFTYAVEKSKELNPDNPRSFYLDALMALNMPDYMGGGPAAAKPIFLEAEKKFNEFTNEDPLWPSWGADLVKGELERMEVAPVNQP